MSGLEEEIKENVLNETAVKQNALKELLESTSIKLLSDHNVQQNTMFHWIRTALKTHVEEMPKVRVLYNNCYGGFGLSKEFQRFCKTGSLYPKQKTQVEKVKDDNAPDSESNSENDDENDDFESDADYISHLQRERTATVPFLIPFAKSVLSDPSCAGLHRVLYMYHTYSFGALIGFATRIVKYTKDKHNCADNLKLLRNYLDDPESVYHGKKHWVPNSFTLTYKNVEFENYSREQLETLFKESIDSDIVQEYYNKIADTRKEMKDIFAAFPDISAETAEQCMKEIVSFVEDDLNPTTPSTRKKPAQTYERIYDFPREKETRSFITIILSEGWKSSKAWLKRMRDVYSQVAIKFLMNKYIDDTTTTDFLTGAVIPDTLLDCEYEHFGLLCASDRYSNLAIANMPALLDYTISEYDGLESVKVS